MGEKSEKRQWSQLQSKVEKWVENSDPSIIVLYLPKQSKRNPYPQIKTVGSDRLKGFIENEEVRKAFVDSVIKTPLSLTFKRPSLKEDMPKVDISILESSMTWKRAKLSELVKMYMKKKKGMSVGYWGSEEFKPEFWPREIPFRPPTTNKALNTRILNKDEMDAVLSSYIEWRKDENDIPNPSPASSEDCTNFEKDEDEDVGPNPSTASPEDCANLEKDEDEDVGPNPSTASPEDCANLEKDEDEDVGPNPSTASPEDCANLEKEEDKDAIPNPSPAFMENCAKLGNQTDKEAVPNPSPVSLKKCLSGKKRKTNETSEAESSRKERKCASTKFCESDESLEELFLEEISNYTALNQSSKCSLVAVKNAEVRYHVGGEVLQGRDLRTLKANNWLNDKVINGYLSLLQSEANLADTDHIFVLPSYLAVLWGNGNYDTWFYRHVQFSRFKWIFLPINKNGNHWVLLVANIAAREVQILDSLGGQNLKFIKQWRTFMTLRSREIQDFEEGEWKRGNMSSNKQTDGHSCGLFVLMNAMALTRDIPPQALTHKCATFMRQYVLCRLIQSAEKPPAQRTRCDMPGCNRPKNQMWAKCSVCGRWLHFSCANIATKPGEYVCTICNAQYE